jgi:hypothetical protein
MTPCNPFTITDNKVSIEPCNYALGDATLYDTLNLSSVDTSTGKLLVTCFLSSSSGTTYSLDLVFSDNDLTEYNTEGASWLFCKISRVAELNIVS